MTFRLAGVNSCKSGPTAGYHKSVWDATDDMGRSLSGGLYIYRIKADGFSKTMKMVLLK